MITRLADGRLVVVWSGSEYGDNVVRYQILNAAGVPLTAPASVFNVEDVSARFVSVAALADGGFVIRGDNTLQRYDAAGIANFPAITLSFGSGGEIAALGTGYVVATAGPGNTVVLNTYSAANHLVFQSTIASRSQAPVDLQVAVRQSADATLTRIVTVWSEPYVDQFSTPFSRVVVQVTNGLGTPVRAAFQVDASTIYSVQPDVAFLADGSFIVSWTYSDFTSRFSPGPYLDFLYTQHFSADGVALNSATPVNVNRTYTLGSSITPLADGGYLLTWNNAGVGKAQQYDANAQKVGAEITFDVGGVNGAVLLDDGHVLAIGDLRYQILSPGIVVSTGNNANNTFQGSDGDDTYNGLTGNDTARGGGGNDLLRGDEGDDFLYGEAGNDILAGGAGFDVIDGGDGFDVLLLDKAPGSYFLETTATGFRLWDGAEFDTVSNVEGFYGPNGAAYSLAEFQKLSFDALSYIAGYADLANGYGADASAGYQHYIQHGQAEGRTIKFNAISYLAVNSDLAAAFGYDPAAAARHFIEHGRFEGRRTGGFDALLYSASNPDLARQFGAYTDALTLHYLQYGAREGRPLTGFDALIYAASNIDVANAYKTNTTSITYHYLNSGADEGRATNTFDPLLYAASHSDLARFFGSNADGAVRHYINYGISEGRASSGFDSVGYLLSNSDLAGIGVRAALMHWLDHGADEGRIGDDLFGREQGQAHGFTNGAAVASLENAGDHDWFEIGMVAGYPAVIRLSGVSTGGGTLTDGWLQLYNEAGVLVATNHGPIGSSDAELVFNPTASGRYFLVVAGETDTQTGTYRVTVTAPPATEAALATLPEPETFAMALDSEPRAGATWIMEKVTSGIAASLTLAPTGEITFDPAIGSATGAREHIGDDWFL